LGEDAESPAAFCWLEKSTWPFEPRTVIWTEGGVSEASGKTRNSDALDPDALHG
jgi:hypothetical protein